MCKQKEPALQKCHRPGGKNLGLAQRTNTFSRLAGISNLLTEEIKAIKTSPKIKLCHLWFGSPLGKNVFDVVWGTRPVVLSQLLVLKTTQPSHTGGEWGTNAKVKFSVSNVLERVAKLSYILQLKNLAPSNKMCCTILRKVWFFLKKTT